MKKNAIWIAICVLAAGCQDRADGTETVTVEDNALGITQVEIHHGDQDGDPLLTIRGTDASDQEIGQVTLRTGMVLYTPDPDLIPAGSSAGTELTVSVATDSFTSITPDRMAHVTTVPNMPTISTFVHLSAVAAAISNEAGIRFSQPNADEVALSAGGCTGSLFPTTVGSPLECCQDGNSTWHKINGGTKDQLLGVRTYTGGGLACRASNGATGCGNGTGGVGQGVGTMCTFGPCGGANSSVSAPNTIAAAVFQPTSQPTVCGADSNGAAAGGGLETPESYDGSQALYPAITASCPYTSCSTPGTPGITVTLIAKCVADGSSITAGGQVRWSEGVNGEYVGCSAPPGIHTVTNTVTFWYPYNSDGTFTHTGSPTTSWNGWANSPCQVLNQATCDVTATGDVTIEGTWYQSGGGGGL